MDLLDWTYQDEQPWCDVQDVNGTEVVFKRRERPSIIFGDENRETAKYIFNAVQPSGAVPFNFVQEL